MTPPVDTFLVYAGYGEVMHRLQVLELSLWIIQSRGLKPGMTDGQAFGKVDKWNATTLGELMRGMRSQTHWPDGIVDRLVDAVDVRNYLAHHFLRDFFMHVPSESNCEHAADQLATISVWLEELADDLDAHAKSLGVLPGQIDEEILAEIDALRPRDWLDLPPDGSVDER